jgi:hypothetical protein
VNAFSNPRRRSKVLKTSYVVEDCHRRCSPFQPTRVQRLRLIADRACLSRLAEEAHIVKVMLVLSGKSDAPAESTPRLLAVDAEFLQDDGASEG